MATTVFYSWQSDHPNRTNRTFIEEALEAALRKISLDGEIQEAQRDEPLTLDKDTKGIPGIPPIADVIFEKISIAAVFVPDLSFVGNTADGRLLPNPNVLIEYGWALSTLGRSRIVPVINVAFGAANTETLPFNMRHLRHPISYELKVDTPLEKRKEVKAKLVADLASAIQLVVQSHPAKTEPSSVNHIAIESTIDPSTFLGPNEPLGILSGFPQKETRLIIPNNQHLFLRVIPTKRVEEFATSKQVLEFLSKSSVRPLCDHLSGWSPGRNRHGAFVCAHNEDKVLAITQLFRNKELWGIDVITIDKESCKEWSKVEFGFIACSSLEIAFTETLSTYLTFCRDILKLELPLRFIAGATGVEEYRMTAPSGINFAGFEKFAGRVVEENLIYEGTITHYELPVTTILRPFFDYVWEECGLSRPDKKIL
ncbi:MAG: hypothetical protein JXM79_08410 [Sedimentisphaerales bacterium]|nr:hypothetical protein [Sedimentisphaerales bacterium]